MNSRTAIVMPWLRAGFSVLLCPNEQRVRELRGVPAAKPEAVATPAKSALPGNSVEKGVAAGFIRDVAASPSTKEALPAAPAVQAAPGGRAPVRADFIRGTVASPSTKESQPSTPAVQAVPSGRAPVRADSRALPFEQWPAAWRALRTRRPMPEHPLVMWTYAGLGDDLTGTPDADRRQVIVRMLQMLGHPGGTHVFWPYELKGGDAREAAVRGAYDGVPGAVPASVPESVPEGASLFWSGVRLFAPRVLLLFGSDARDALAMPRTLLPFSQERVDGRLVIQLPRPQSFVGDEAAFARAHVFLGRILQFCSRRMD